MAASLARALILTITVLALIFIADNQPRPVKSVQVDYCVITYKAAAKNPMTGEMMSGWATGYGPCSLLDRYENI